MKNFLVLRRLTVFALAGLALALSAMTASAQQFLTRAEGVDRGAAFDEFFERPAPCITRIMDAPAGGGSVVINLDCRNRLLGTTVLFDLFRGILLNPAWRVTSFSTSTGQIVTSPTGTTPRISVRLRTEPGTQITATVTVMVAPASVPEPLPNCARALQQRPRDFVCHADADCPPRVAGGPAETCSVACGNRCVPR